MPESLHRQAVTTGIESDTDSKEQTLKATTGHDLELIAIIISLRQMQKKAEACREQANELSDEINILRKRFYLLMAKVEPTDKARPPLNPDLPHLSEIQRLLGKTSSSERRKNIKKISLSDAALEHVCLLLDEMQKGIDKKFYRPDREPIARNSIKPLQRKDIVILGLLLRQPGSLVTVEELAEISGYEKNCMRSYVYALNAYLKDHTHYRIFCEGDSCKIVTI